MIAFGNLFQKDENGLFVIDKTQAALVAAMIISCKANLKQSTIEITINHKLVKVVRYVNIIDLELFTNKSRRLLVKEFLTMAFTKSKVTTPDGRIIRITSGGGGKKLSVFNEKQCISLYSDNLVQVAYYSKTAVDEDDKRRTYYYYDCFISFGNDIYQCQLNITFDDKGFNLYDINKIEKKMTLHSPSKVEGGSSPSNPNISNNN